MPTFLVPTADVHGLIWRRALGQSDTPRRSPEQVRYLIAYDWPGNIRELRNHADCWALAIPPDAEDRAARPKSGMTFSEVVETFERALIAAELLRQSGNVARTTLHGIT